MGFYEDISDRYDRITNTSARSRGAQAFVRALMERYRIQSALDAACGNGVFAIPLAQMGTRVLASDISPAMIEQGRHRADVARVNIDWLVSPMENLDEHPAGPFDAILCMGNSLPHLLDEARLRRCFNGFAQKLSPGAPAVLALLNYRKTLKEKERIVGIDRDGDTHYIRFYDFLPDMLQFNVLEITYTPERVTHRMNSTMLRPWTLGQLRDALANAGFDDVQAYGSLEFEPLDENRHDTIMLVASRS